MPASPPHRGGGSGGGGGAAAPKPTDPAPAPPAALPGLAGAAAATAKDDANDAIKVYLRIRPLTSDEEAADGQTPFLEMAEASPATVTVVPPANSKKQKHKGSNDPASYSFTEICREKASQEQVFQKTTLPMVGNVIEGKNALLFTYGVTNSGKTYTVQGTPEQPGLVPRSLDVLFNSIESQREEDAEVQPYCFDGTKPVGASDRIQVSDLKADCVAAHKKMKTAGASQPALDAAAIAAAIQAGAGAAAAASGSSDGAGNEDEEGGSKMDEDEDEDSIELNELASDQRLRDQTKLPVSTKHKYLVYVSFVEIYNEFVYDLLVPVASKKDRRAACRIGETKAGDVFIRGTREVHVTSSTEALEVMAMGQLNRQMGATASNKESSRSHCLFTIKLIKLDASGYSSRPSVSQMTIVDLAGSERSDKTDAKGQRMKEAGNINASLMHLGKCLDAIKWNQQQKKGRNQRLIPYRDSKLTRIFKNYFEGKGNGTIRMVVNISEVSDAFDETSHVLRFSAIARQVNTAAATSKINTGISKLRSEIEESLTSEIMDLEDYNIGLLEKLAALQEQLHAVEHKSSQIEIKIRQEVMEEMAEQMEEMEKGFQIAASQQNNAVESKYEKKWEAYTHSVARLPARSRVPAQQEPAAAAAGGIDLSSELAAAVAAAATATAATESATAALSALTREHATLQMELAELKRNNELLDYDLDVAEDERAKAETAAQKAEEEHADELAILEQTAVATAGNHVQAMEALTKNMREAHAAEMQEVVAKSDALRNKYEEQIRCHKQEAADAQATSKESAADVVERCKQLEIELDTADARLAERPTAEAVAAIGKERDAVLAQMTKLEQRHRFDVSKRDRKIRAHEDTIETLSQSSAALEKRNTELQQQAAAMLQTHMDEEVVKYGKTKAGSALSRAGSVVYNKGSVPSIAKQTGSRNMLEVPDAAGAGPAAATAVDDGEGNDDEPEPKPKRSSRSRGRKAASVGADEAASVEPEKPKRRTRSNGTHNVQKKAAEMTRRSRSSAAANEAEEVEVEVSMAVAEAEAVESEDSKPVRRSRRTTRSVGKSKAAIAAEDAVAMTAVDATPGAAVDGESSPVAPSSLMVWSPDPEPNPNPEPTQKQKRKSVGVEPELQGKENDADADAASAAPANVAATVAAAPPTKSTRKKRKLYKKGVLSPLGDSAIDPPASTQSMLGRFVDSLTPRRLRPRRKGTSA